MEIARDNRGSALQRDLLFPCFLLARCVTCGFKDFQERIKYVIVELKETSEFLAKENGSDHCKDGGIV